MHPIVQKAGSWLRACMRPFGLSIEYIGSPRSGTIPDARLYQPFFRPWLAPSLQTRLRKDDPRALVTLERKYVLWQLVRQSLRAASGDVAECGVYRGGTAYLLADAVRLEAANRCVHLFDTFHGMPPVDERYDLHKEHDFADTGLDDVRAYLTIFDNVEFHQGTLPATFSGLEERTFCFVHIDVDIHDAVRDATEFFYPRVPRGGVIVYDDYGWPTCPGARKAVDDFFADKPEVPLVLANAQCIVVKL